MPAQITLQIALPTLSMRRVTDSKHDEQLRFYRRKTTTRPTSIQAQSNMNLYLLAMLFFTGCLVDVAPGKAQEIPKSGFAVLNLVSHEIPIRICLEGNEITSGKEAIPTGYYSGLMPWDPPKAILTAQAPGYQTAELKPFLKITETPLIVLREAPGKILQFTVFPNSKERLPSFYDAINLTSQENLTIQVDKKPVTLPRNQRIRLSKAKAFSYSLQGREPELIDPVDGGNYFMVFYSRSDGSVDCFVTFDNPL